MPTVAKNINFPRSLWGEMLFAAVYISNRSPDAALHGAAPYSKMRGKEVDMTGLQTSGPGRSYTSRYIRPRWGIKRRKSSYADSAYTAGLFVPTTPKRGSSRKAGAPRSSKLRRASGERKKTIGTMASLRKASAPKTLR